MMVASFGMLPRKPASYVWSCTRQRFEKPMHSVFFPLHPPKPAEATPRFSPNRKEIDNSPVLRYCSGQKKAGLNFLYITASTKE